METDIVIIGGGPAGAAAAIESTRAGLDCVVVDKATFPRDKCCGDGLTTGALRRLDELGLDPSAVPSWKVVTDVTLRTPGGRTVRFPLGADDPDSDVADGRSRGGTFAAVARRRELDDALLGLATRSGADVRQGHELIGVQQDAEIVSAEVVGPDGPTTIVGRYLVAADGMWSSTRKLLGLNDPSYRGDWHAFRQYFTGVSGAALDDLTVWFEPDLLPGYMWSFPEGDGTANVGFGVLRQSGRSVQYMKSVWPELLKRPHVAELLGPDAEPEAPHRAWPIPARLGHLPRSAGRVFFVGDAVAATDPMTGEGIGQALETGGDAVAAMVEAGLGDDRAARMRYERTLDRGMVKDHGMARTLSKVLATEAGVEWSIRVAGVSGWTRRNFARWLFEDYPRATLVTPGRWQRGVFSSPGAYAAR